MMENEKRLIYANEIEDLFYKQVEWGATDLMDAFNDALQDAQTVDAVEVVHGRWERVIPTKSAAKWSIKVSCSVCHKQGYSHHKYCPNCGAKMDGERKDDG